MQTVLFLLVLSMFGGGVNRGLAAISSTSISKAVGTIRDQVITSREVRLNSIVEWVLFSQKSEKTPAPNFDSELDRVLLEWVIFFEAKNFAVTEVKDAEVQNLEKTFLKNVSGSSYIKDWALLEATSVEIQGAIERKLKAKKLLDFKNRSSAVPISDAEALKYFQSNRGKFSGLSFDKVSDRIKVFLNQSNSEKRVQEWISVLQRKYQAKKLVGLPPSSN